MQISAYALHDVSPPLLLACSRTSGGDISITWRVRPGFTYSVWHSENLADWQPEGGPVFEPGGNAPVDYTFSAPINPLGNRFYRLGQAE